jgi:hypothetical protein
MNINVNESTIFVDSQFSRLLKFFIFVPIDIISIPLSISIICHLYKKNRQNRNLSDDILIILILISLIDIIFQQSGVLIYFELSFVWPESNIYCIIWNYFNYFDYYLNLYLTVWASIERHILIFHIHFFDNNKKRFFFHRFPLILIILYGIFVYLGLLVFDSCQNNFQMNQPWCGGVCFEQNQIKHFCHWIINTVLPICLIIILNILLIIRIIRQKNRIKQNRSIWCKCRKLTIQMISISSIYLICFLPSGIIYVLRILLNNNQFGENAFQICFQYTFLFANSLLPFVTISLLPDLRKKIKFIFKRIIPILNQAKNVKIRPIVTQIQDVQQE